MTKDERWAALFAKLEKLRRYEDDWDGEGASAADPHLFDVAKDYLQMRRNENPECLPEHVFIDPDGYPFIEWNLSPVEIIDDIMATGIVRTCYDTETKAISKETISMK